MTQVRPNPDVVFCEVEDGAVLLSASDEVYFGLNEVGAKVWTLLPPASSGVDEICDRLCDQYPEVDPTTVRQDVRELLDELSKHGLLVTEENARA